MSHPRICSDPECFKLRGTRGFCDTHYRYWRYHNVQGVKEQQRDAQRLRRQRDVTYRLAANLRNRIYFSLSGRIKTGSAVQDLGCTLSELKQHIEVQFSDGMNWENWSRSGWHIDHIMPLASFDLTDRDQFLKATHFTNLRPIWAKENLTKGPTIE